MRNSVCLLASILLSACPSPEKTDTGPVDTDPGDTDPGDTDSPVDTSTPGCQENALGEIPKDAEWIILDGNSTEMLSFDMEVFTDEYQGYEGVYNLNTLEVFGANGFKLEAPAQVVGAQVRWTNLPKEPSAVSLLAWPDFGSNGYDFRFDAPIGEYTRCLDANSNGEWVDYVFPEPFEIEQMLQVYVGYHRDEVAGGGIGEAQYVEPELQFEYYFNKAEPLYSGLRWPQMDTESFYGGTSTSWYTWQVRLAVIYDRSLLADQKPFQPDPALAASSRVAWGDFDNDGWDDLMSSGPLLHHNNGDGTFSDITATAIPGGVNTGTGGGVWGDYDNDGFLDYFGQGGSYSAADVLLHNNGDGTFTDVGPTCGIDDTQSERDCDGDGLAEHSPTEGAGWVDYDGDGFLDLYLANYECSSEYDYYLNYDDFLFRNNADGTFSDVTELVDLDQTNQAGRGVTVGDYDQDGDVDWLVSNYRLDRNFFYQNQGKGLLEEIARDNGTAGTQTMVGFTSYYGHTIGSAFGDIDNDGDIDIIEANLAHPRYYAFSDRTNVLIQDSGIFTNEAEIRGVYYRETHSNPTLFDADNDGDLDLFITAVYGGRDSDFYVNDGGGNFALRNWESGLVVQNGWGAAASDYDNDGDMDMVAYGLYRNDLFRDPASEGNHWLEVRPIGFESNVSAMGAFVEVEVQGRHQVSLVSGGSGTSSQDSQFLHFGLGTDLVADSVTVHFPYQADVVELTDVPADQRIWVRSDGETATGFSPPDWLPRMK